MLVLLPPSESKTAANEGPPVDLDALSFPALNEHRRETLQALAVLSASPLALDVLKVGAGTRDQVAANVQWEQAPATAVHRLYSGVLFDALGRSALPAKARKRVDDWCVVVSAAWGALHMTDRVAPYRLSMSVTMPGLGPLASWWRPALNDALAERAHGQLVVDCRSSSYAAAYTPRDADWVSVRVFTRTVHSLKPVSHHAKHTRGEVVRFLAMRDGRAPTTAHALASALGEHWEVSLTEPGKNGQRTVDVVLSA